MHIGIPTRYAHVKYQGSPSRIVKYMASYKVYYLFSQGQSKGHILHLVCLKMHMGLIECTTNVIACYFNQAIINKLLGFHPNCF